MTAYLTFFPLGNADTTLIRLANNDLVLMDYADRRNADDPTDKRVDLPKALRDELDDAVAGALFDIGEQAGRPFLVLELLEGKTLEQLLSGGPLTKGAGWTRWVNGVESESELEALRRSLNRGTPFGDPDWQQDTARRLGLEASLNPRGRPRKG